MLALPSFKTNICWNLNGHLVFLQEISLKILQSSLLTTELSLPTTAEALQMSGFVNDLVS